MDLIGLENRIFTLVNQHRKKAHRLVLNEHEVVKQIAKVHALDMATQQVAFGHAGFKKRVYQLGKRLNVVHCGENLAYNRSENPAETAFAQWLESPSHKATLEKGIFTHTGVSVAYSALEQYYYIVQLFARL